MANPDLPQEASSLLRTARSLLRGGSSLLRGPGEPACGWSGGSAPAALHDLARLAAAGVTGCSGASAALWQGGKPAVFAASHPDLAELATIERGGPVAAAVATGAGVCSPDILQEDRWPGWAAAALARGVRCAVILVHRSGPGTVTLSLFGALPGQPSRQDQLLARLAGVFAGRSQRHPAGLEAGEARHPGPTGS